MKKKINKEVLRYLGIAVGVMIESLSYALFLVPNNIAPGGLTAVSIIVRDATHGFMPVGLTYFILNIPWLFFAWKRMGHKYVIRTLIISFVTFVFIDSFIYLLKPVVMAFDAAGKLVKPDVLILAAVFGGILNGLGIGITFKNRASAGGTDLISQVIHYWTGFPFGQAVLIIDTFVIGALGVYFLASGTGMQLSLYAMIALIVSSFVIDAVQEGISYTKQMMIVTTFQKEVLENVLTKVGRGVTMLPARGGYSQVDRTMMIIAIHRSQVSLCKNAVIEIDPKAFIMVSPLNEVVGEGFKQPVIEEW
jgi:uncharacterized membrane-anchored protein YitT (DUF2179 family)